MDILLSRKKTVHNQPMELFYLLCSVVSSSITSLTLSFLLLIRRFVTRPAAVGSNSYVSLYEGTVWHERRRPVHHYFQYNVRYALFDLDQATNVPADHLSGDQARRTSETNGPVFLLTIPPSVGYEQNPLSIYYCYDIEGSTHNLKKCIAEVTNTPWGERVTFLFDPKSDIVAKPLHVSPFMDMLGSWSIKTNAPEDNIRVAISVQHPELGNYFTATLRVKRISTRVEGDPALFFWLMPQRVAIWIYWHAFRLWWKGVSFIQHPRYHSPKHREEALLRDSKLQNKESWNEDDHQQSEGSSTSNVAKKSLNPRCCVWRDAKWPWC